MKWEKPKRRKVAEKAERKAAERVVNFMPEIEVHLKMPGDCPGPLAPGGYHAFIYSGRRFGLRSRMRGLMEQSIAERKFNEIYDRLRGLEKECKRLSESLDRAHKIIIALKSGHASINKVPLSELTKKDL